jgi:serine protease
VVRTPPNAYPVVDYVVEYRSSIFGRFQKYDDTVSPDTQVTLRGLSEDKTYYIRIAAKNKKGTQGKYSNVLKITTQKSKPTEPKKPSGSPTAPRSVSAVATTLAANITFSSPEDTGKSTIQYYTITSNPENKTLKYTPATNSGTFTAQMSGLTAGTTYTFTVTATNSFGTSPASAPSNSVYIASTGGGGGGG